MPGPRISIGGKEIVATGSVTFFGDESIDVHPFPPNEPPYRVEITFKTAPGAEGQVFQQQVAPDHHRLVFQNFNSVSWLSNSNPLYVANFKNRRVYLNVAGSVLGEAPSHKRVIAFTFYLGEIAA